MKPRDPLKLITRAEFGIAPSSDERHWAVRDFDFLSFEFLGELLFVAVDHSAQSVR